MSAYFIKNVAVTDSQVREHLAQTQKEKSEEKNETRAINRD
jgi:hypothetical protein